MQGFLLVLLMSIKYVRPITSCPASCVVCSEDAIICHKLSNIIGVPETTKVLMLTDGQIDSMDNGNFSDLSNMMLLGLSNNAITNITESAFQNLTVLRVLLLDHNLITSASILSSAFSQLRSLEILELGNNAIRVIHGHWFRDTRTLLTLQLDGNLIGRLESATFRSANLEKLETLDLSDNLIEHVERGSFRALPRLRRLDLSRNSLRTAPDAFSYLTWLSALNLDHNQWNCTCELQELSTFLSSYIEAPDKVLYNGRQLVCLSAANPAVHTVLQLTEANCVPPNKNITVVIAAKESISAHQYARDVALAAMFFFAGGVGLTVGVLYIFYTKLELKKAWSAWRDRHLDDEGGGATQNHGMPEWSFTGDNKTQVLSIIHPGQDTKLMSPNITEVSNQRPWLREAGPAGLGPAIPKHHFVCHRCSPDGRGQGQCLTRQGGRSAFSRQEDVLHNHVDWKHLTGEKPPPSPIRLSPPFHRNAPTPYSTMHGETHKNGTRGDFSGSYSRQNGLTQTIPTLPDYLTIHCAHCLKAHDYRQAKGTFRTAEMDAAPEGALETRYRRKGISESNRQSHRKRGLNENHTGAEGHGREPHISNNGTNIPLQRTVTFNLTGSDAHMTTAPNRQSHKVKGHTVKRSDVQKLREKHRPGDKSARKSNRHEKGDHSKRHKHRVQSNGLLKVKVNLNPFRKNKVHPKEHSDPKDMQLTLEKAGTVSKITKLSSKDKMIHFKNRRDSRAVSETKRKSSKVSKTDHAEHAKKLGQSTSAKQSHDISKKRVKSFRPKTSRVKHTEPGSCDLEAVDQEISESYTPLRKRTKKGRQQDLSMEDDARDCQTNLVKSQEVNSLSLSKSSKRIKNFLETDKDSQESLREQEGKRQPQSVNVMHQTSVKDDSNDATRTLELKEEQPSGSCRDSVLQKMSPKEVSIENQPAKLELKEGDEPILMQGGTSLVTEKMSGPDVTEESLRPSQNSSVLQAQVNSPDTNPTQDTQRANILDLGEALVGQKPPLHTGSGNTESIQEEGPSVIKKSTAFTAEETGRESANTMSVEEVTKQSIPGPVRPTLGDQGAQQLLEMDQAQAEIKPLGLSEQGSSGMLPNPESERKIVDMLTVAGEPKMENGPTSGSLGDNSDGAMRGVSSPQASAGPGLPQSHSTEPLAHAGVDGSSHVDPLAAPNSQPAADLSNQMTMGGPGPADIELDEENLSNNNSLKLDSSNSLILQEYVPASDGSAKRKLRLILPERPRNRPITPLDKKIR